MRRYETIVIVRPNVSEEEIEAVINRTNSIIEGDGGTVIRVDKWGLKKLAYLIKKEAQGYYIYLDYAGIPAAVSEMERIFRIDDKILKYLTVKLADSCDPEAAKEELAKAETQEPVEDTVEEKPVLKNSVEEETVEEKTEEEKQEEEPVPVSDDQED